jgi:hypothetical protein
MERLQGESSTSRMPQSTLNQLAEMDRRIVPEQVKELTLTTKKLPTSRFFCVFSPSYHHLVHLVHKKIAMDIWIYRSLCP